ncbi:hypothetical protein BDZ91DRAFT_807467 [Kalaharituber pfeilii]|nr:hypothetical protein BDZ91DRAFT_807467 [Kalaharituber pfeilii]
MPATFLLGGTASAAVPGLTQLIAISSGAGSELGYALESAGESAGEGGAGKRGLLIAVTELNSSCQSLPFDCEAQLLSLHGGAARVVKHLTRHAWCYPVPLRTFARSNFDPTRFS